MNKKIKKLKFHHHKNAVVIDDVDINKLLTLNKASSSEKQL